MQRVGEIPLLPMGVLPQCVGQMPQVVSDSRHNLVNQNALRCDPRARIRIFIDAVV